MKYDNDYMLAMDTESADCIYVGIKKGEEILEYVELDLDGALETIEILKEWVESNKEVRDYHTPTYAVQ